MDSRHHRHQLDKEIEKLINWDAFIYHTNQNTSNSTNNATIESRDVVPNTQLAEEEKELGNQAVKQKQYQNALLHYNRSLQLNPQSPVCLSNRAFIHLKLHNYVEAKSDCLKALQYSPSNLKALHRLGQSYSGLHEYKEAVEVFTEALHISPHHSSTQTEIDVAIKELTTRSVVVESCDWEEELIAAADTNDMYSPIHFIHQKTSTSIDTSFSVEEMETKQRNGDELYLQNNIEEAVQQYTEGLETSMRITNQCDIPHDVVASLYAGRSRCWLQCNRYASSMADEIHSKRRYINRR